MPTSLAMRYLR